MLVLDIIIDLGLLEVSVLELVFEGAIVLNALNVAWCEVVLNRRLLLLGLEVVVSELVLESAFVLDAVNITTCEFVLELALKVGSGEVLSFELILESALVLNAINVLILELNLDFMLKLGILIISIKAFASEFESRWGVEVAWEINTS